MRALTKNSLAPIEECKAQVLRSAAYLGALRAKRADKQTQLREVFESLKAIAALVANGHGDNRYNMSFQRYVQSIYFEDVLQAASVRLEKMSDGRYLGDLKAL